MNHLKKDCQKGSCFVEKLLRVKVKTYFCQHISFERKYKIYMISRNNYSNVDPIVKKIGKEYIVRSEKNGITVYDNTTDQYVFYSSLLFDQVSHIETSQDLRCFLQTHRECISRDIDFSAPFRVNWLIENRCNLDCIYCFASDKMMSHNSCDNRDYSVTVSLLKKLRIMNVSLTGGEPTLNPNLPNIVLKLSQFATVNIDTNGSIDCFDDSFIEILKHENVLVRISVDSFENKIEDKVRPCKNKGSSSVIIKKNIEKLIKNGVNILVHTVVTSYNLTHLHTLAQELKNLRVKRWHIYGVHKSLKCANFYDEIKINIDELASVVENLKIEFSGLINISMFMDEKEYSANSILFVDEQGRLFVDSIYDGVQFIDFGNLPPLKVVAYYLNIKSHCNDYLALDIIGGD